MAALLPAILGAALGAATAPPPELQPLAAALAFPPAAVARGGAGGDSPVAPLEWSPGRTFEVVAAPGFLTVLALRPGERLLAKAAGDTARWIVGETSVGDGPLRQTLVLVKPASAGLTTNLVLSTSERLYLVALASRGGPPRRAMISWTYPEPEARRTAAPEASEPLPLNFGYAIDHPARQPKPRWEPIRAFDDGRRTFLQLPASVAAMDAPPLFLVGPDGRDQLVNYRVRLPFYVVDRLADRFELRLGAKRQEVVTVTRMRTP